MYEDVAPGIGLVRLPERMLVRDSREAAISIRYVREQGLVRIMKTVEDPSSGAVLVYGEINPCFLP